MISNLPTLLGQQDFNAEHSDMLAAARDGRTVDPKAREVSLVSGQGQAVIATDGPVIVYTPNLVWVPKNDFDAQLRQRTAAARMDYAKQAQEERRRQSDFVLWCRCNGRDTESAAARRDYDREAAIEGQSLPNVSVTQAINAALADFRERDRQRISQARMKAWRFPATLCTDSF
jgi:hypothetical protein